MARYVYRTIDIQSNLVLEDIDLQDVQFSIKLSGVGDLTGSLFVPETKRGLLLDDATFPGRTGVYVLRDGVPVWGGIIWKRDWHEEDSTFQLSCGSWESYAYHILQLNNLSYTSTDQFQIAREILARNGVQVESGIEWSTNMVSGVNRQRNLYSYEYKTVGLELEQLAGLENGFDFTVRSYMRSDGAFGRRYEFGYPRLGRTASLDPAKNSLTFDYPGNLLPFQLVEDAESGATSLFALGSGEGQAMLVAQAGDGALRAGSTPDPTLAASALLNQLISSPNNVNVADWTYPGCPPYVARNGVYLRNLAEQDKVTPIQNTSTVTGAVPEITQAAQLILDRLNAGLTIFEDWTWAGCPAIVGRYNGVLLDIYRQSGGSVNDIARSKVFLQSFIAGNPAPTKLEFNGIDWAPVKTWLTAYINGHPAPYTFDPTPDTEYAAWPRLDAVTQYKDVLFSATLQQHANEDYKELTPPIDSWSFTLSPDSDVKITDFSVGDSAVFRLSSRRWRQPKVMIRRITEIKVRPGTHSTLETVELGLSEERS